MARAFIPHVVTEDSALGGSFLERSLRFNDADSAYLTRTPSSAGDRRTWTWSGWVKRANAETNMNLFSVRESASVRTIIRITDGLDFLDDDIIRAEKSDAIPKLYVRNINSNVEEEIKISSEPIGVPGASLMQKDTNTSKIRISWESMATPGKIFEYDIKTKEKKLVKEVEIPSGHDPNRYVVERIKAN